MNKFFRNPITPAVGAVGGVNALMVFPLRVNTNRATSRTPWFGFEGQKSEGAQSAPLNFLYVTGSQDGILLASAKNDINLIGAQILNASEDGTTVLDAGRDLNLKTITVAQSESVVFNADNYLKDQSSSELGSQISGAGDVKLKAGNDVNARAAQVSAGNILQVEAESGSINIEAGRSTRESELASKTTSKGLLSKRSLTQQVSSSSDEAVGSSFEGAIVTLSANEDVNIKGSTVVSDTYTQIKADRDVNITADENQYSERHFKETKKSGLMSSGGGGVGFTAGKKQNSTDSKSTTTTAAGATVASLAGNVDISAGNRYTQVGSDILTPQGDIDIAAKTVEIKEARETYNSEVVQKSKQSGLTVALSSPLISAVQTTQSMQKAAKNTESDRMKALAGAAAALNIYNNAGAIANAVTDPTKAVSVSVSVGASKSESKETTTANTVRGSTLAAGGNVSIKATGGGDASDILIQGSKIDAAQNVTLKADDDIKLLAARNDSETHSTNKSSSGSIGVSAGAGGVGITIAANKASGRGEGAETYYTNTQIKAGNNTGNTLTLESGGDTTLKGAVAGGNTVVADIGGNLLIESLQDKSTYKESQKSSGGSITLSPAGIPTGGSISAGRTNINSNFESVTEQSALRAGDGGFQVNVEGNTTLNGGAITSTQKAIDDKLNSFETGGILAMVDIQNQASYEARSAGGTMGVGSQLSSSGAGAGQASGEASSTTTSGISGVAGDAAKRTGDAEQGIKPIFDKEAVKLDVEAQVQITTLFGQQAGQAVKTYTENARKELQDKLKNAKTPEERAALQQEIKDAGLQERALNILIGALTGMVGASITQEVLGAASDQMRELMIEDSQKFKGVCDTSGYCLNNDAPDLSEGVDQDDKKIGGTRVDLDLLCESDRCAYQKDADNKVILDANGKPKILFDDNGQVKWTGDKPLKDFLDSAEGKAMYGITGGIQGYVGTLFGKPYTKGSWQDKLIEAFAGPHDFIGGKLSGLYDERGNATQGRSEQLKFMHEVWSGVAIPVTAPFAAANMPPQVWLAISQLLRMGR